MTIPGGFKQLAPWELFDAVTQAQNDEAEGREARGRRQQIRAQAYAQVCAMHKCGVNEMTPAMRAYADAIERRMLGQGVTSGKGYGFSIPTEGRRPNSR